MQMNIISVIIRVANKTTHSGYAPFYYKNKTHMRTCIYTPVNNYHK